MHTGDNKQESGYLEIRLTVTFGGKEGRWGMLRACGKLVAFFTWEVIPRVFALE